MSKKAIVVGYGGIGKNVYVPQLENLGYDVDVVDPFHTFTDYDTVNDVPKSNEYDIAVICCPNEHHLNAVLELSDVCKNILVEKPGLANTKAWNRTVKRFPNHNIVLVKNNLYRDSIETYETLINVDDVTKVEINWLNKDRIPSPGSWFTNKEKAFGGVTHDLFPHLYCFMFALFPFHSFRKEVGETFMMQRWNLDNIGDNTDYGEINRDGVYNVCDYAEQHFMLERGAREPLPVTLRASWKEGYDDQAIHIHYNSGGKLRLEFGLCPDYAYGEMIKAVAKGQFMRDPLANFIEQEFDEWIHTNLESFNREN